MADAAPGAAGGAPAPGRMDLPASLDNFDAIVSSFDNAPDPVAPPLARQPKQHAPEQAPPEQFEDDLADGGELEQQFDENGDPIEPEEVLEQPTDDDFALAAKAKEWTERPDLPEEFLNKLGTVKIDGVERQVTVKEAFDSFQRRAVTTQKQQEAAAVKNHYEQMVQGQRQQFQRWGSDPTGKAMFEDLVDMGMPQVAEGVARYVFGRFAQRQRTLDAIGDPQLRAGAARDFEEAEQMRLQARQDARARAQAEQRAQQNDGTQQQQAVMQRTANQMAQHAPKALREVGWTKITPYVKNLISQEVRAIHQFGTELTYETVLDAVKTAKDVWDEAHERAVTKAAEGKVRSRAMPPRRTSANPGTGPVRVAPKNAPARVSDMDKILADMDGRR